MKGKKNFFEMVYMDCELDNAVRFFSFLFNCDLHFYTNCDTAQSGHRFMRSVTSL